MHRHIVLFHTFFQLIQRLFIHMVFAKPLDHLFEVVVFFADQLGVFLAGFVLQVLLMQQLLHGVHIVIQSRALHNTVLQQQHKCAQHDLIHTYNHSMTTAQITVNQCRHNTAQSAQAGANQQYPHRKCNLELIIELHFHTVCFMAKHSMCQQKASPIAQRIYTDQTDIGLHKAFYPRP